MTPTRKEVAIAAENAFPNTPAAAIMEILDLYGVEAPEGERERVQLAILKLCGGDEGKLLEYVDAAKSDYRDLLHWAEAAESSSDGERNARVFPRGESEPFSPENAKAALEARLRRAGIDTSALSLVQGVRAMIDFYRDSRVQGCDIDEDGDMLLFEWRAGGAGSASSFECVITRQFTATQSEEEDPRMSQLSLSFSFPALSVLETLKNGQHWCGTPGDLEAFEANSLGSSVCQAAGALRPLRVTLDDDEA